MNNPAKVILYGKGRKLREVPILPNTVLYLPFFLLSFLCPKYAHVLNVYFGVPGSGKTTFAAYLTKWALHENILIRLCRKHPNRLTALLLNSRYLKRRIDVYSNVPITGAYELNAKEDIGHWLKVSDLKQYTAAHGLCRGRFHCNTPPQAAAR